ncbi:glycosyltransferase family 4 protein [Leptolyngbya sp. AN10]|uniref:glycosyltransferase family 4 protein n=1 Tax=Leptolyngbya sp. AN10 TaxID=3423365 RepID=UPI003D31DCD3
MQIAIVAPSPVPFCIGGAEKLWWGLQEEINQNTPHQAELIKLPSPERNFADLIGSYWQFSRLDLSHFDLVISGKYPSWMVDHPNHICYMLHRLRGLYDTYHFTGFPEQFNSNQTEIQRLQKQFKRSKRSDLVEVFAQLEKLRSQQNLPTEVTQFPGAFSREIIHYFDGIGLDPKAIRKYAAISHNVANRQDYFPKGSSIDVIYPPSSLRRFEQGESEYFFTISRLDSAKRVRLLVEAMRFVQSNVQLKIAGIGPDKSLLKELAGDDDRIEFLGFVNDEDVIQLYANAIAVPYLPYDEDYGLVVIEAMMSGKPVLTTIDAGGPNEFVINGETGYSVSPEPAALAERLDYFYQHRAETKQMGLAGRKLVETITWESTVARLLSEPPTKPMVNGTQKRQKITIAVTFSVFPPRGGGQSRVFHLYKHLANYFDIEFVSITGFDQVPFEGEIAENVREIRIPKSTKHQQQEQEIEKEVRVPITDVVMPDLVWLTPEYIEALKTSIESSDIVIACHPYLYPAIRSITNKPLWYEAQDVEIDLKSKILPDNSTSRKILDSIRKVEIECCDASRLIMTCSRNDADLLNKIYGIDLKKTIEVPNGVDTEAIRFISQEKRRSTKSKLGLENSFTAFFLGSWHEPNLKAVESILKMADALPDVNFLIVGSVGWAFQDKKHPTNIGFMGEVDEETKSIVLEIADVALNPVTFGSGTNLKMLEYFAAGIPVISTPAGIRGLGVEHGKHCIVAEVEQFGDAIGKLRSETSEAKLARIEAAKDLVQQTYDWRVIAERFMSAVTAFE